MWRILLFELVILLIAVGVWLLAPLIGIESKVYRVLIILGLVLPPIAYFLWKFISERQAAKSLEDGLQKQAEAQQAQARPDRQDDLRVLNDNFAAAVSRLREQKHKGRKGTALYSLPWYMIIGPPAAGKSTALRESGIDFYDVGGERTSVKGVGGTRNCDWWFSDQAILLDTAGRYTSEDEDLEEWQEFLGLLKRHRKKRPLNGLLVCISIADLMGASAEAITEKAEKIRSRLDQVLAELEMVLPIYVLFSKCDLMSGFVEYFDDLNRTGQGQVFGFTVPLTRPENDNVEPLFNREFENISAGLHKRMVHRLALSKPTQRSAIYKFPRQFAAAQKPLGAFLKKLFLYNPYAESPRLRGVYFCSGTQEGQPFNKVMSDMANALGLRETMAESFPEKLTKKSYFLRELFERVVFPDQTMAGYTASGHSRRWRLKVATMIAGFVVALTLLGLSTTSFIQNMGLVSRGEELTRKLKVRGEIADPDEAITLLGQLDAIGRYYERLQSYEKNGPPWHYRFFYYSGDKMIEPSQRVYARASRRFWGFAAFIGEANEVEKPLRDVLAQGWGKDIEEVSRGYDMVRLYLMLTSPKRMVVDDALPTMLKRLKLRLPPSVTNEEQGDLLRRVAKRYLELIKAGRAKWGERDEELLARVRRKMQDPDVDVLYKRNIAALEKSMEPVTLRKLLGGKVTLYLTASKDVSGVFTQKGWKEVKKRIKETADEGWVIYEEASETPEDALKKRYMERYIEAWQAFLEGVDIQNVRDEKDALELLDRLTGPTSLYRKMLESLVGELDFRASSDTSTLVKVAGESRALKKKMAVLNRVGADKKAKEAAAKAHKPNRVEKQFAKLMEFVKPQPDSEGKTPEAGLQQYLDKLEVVRKELFNWNAQKAQGDPDTRAFDDAVNDINDAVNKLVRPLPSKEREALRTLLSRPVTIAKAQVSGVTLIETVGDFSAGVCDVFRKKFAGKYPFANSQEPAYLNDVVAFFKPGTGKLWAHVSGKMNSVFDVSEQGVQVKTGQERSALAQRYASFLKSCMAITRALFDTTTGQVGVKFVATPDQPVAAEGSGLFVSDTVLAVGGTRKTYHNGPKVNWAMAWPGDGLSGASLTIRGKGFSDTLRYDGKWAEWGLMKLLERARVRTAGSQFRADWAMEDGKVTVPITFRPTRSDHPLLLRQLIRGLSLVCK